LDSLKRFNSRLPRSLASLTPRRTPTTHPVTYSLESLSLRPAESFGLLRQDDTRRDVSDQLRNRFKWTSQTCKPCFYLHPSLFPEASAVGSILFTTNIHPSGQVRSILVDPSSVRPGQNQTKSNSNHFVSTNQPWLFNLKHLQQPLILLQLWPFGFKLFDLVPNSYQVALTHCIPFYPFLSRESPCII
jgi:hypothetical protein